MKKLLFFVSSRFSVKFGAAQLRFYCDRPSPSLPKHPGSFCHGGTRYRDGSVPTPAQTQRSGGDYWGFRCACARATTKLQCAHKEEREIKMDLIYSVMFIINVCKLFMTDDQRDIAWDAYGMFSSMEHVSIIIILTSVPSFFSIHYHLLKPYLLRVKLQSFRPHVFLSFILSFILPQHLCWIYFSLLLAWLYFPHHFAIKPFIECFGTILYRISKCNIIVAVEMPSLEEIVIVDTDATQAHAHAHAQAQAQAHVPPNSK